MRLGFGAWRLKFGLCNSALKELRAYPFVFPAQASEQAAIVEALSDADALIESLEQLIAKKRQIKQGAMQELLTGQRRLPGFSGEWKAQKLGDVVDKLVGGGTPSRANPEFWNGEIPWVTVKDFSTFDPFKSQENITSAGLSNSASNLIPRGTIITSTRMALGKALIYNVDVAINQDLKALFLSKYLNSKYLYYWFQYNAPLIEDLGSGSTVKGISLLDMKKIEINLPALNEQISISKVFDDMDSEISILEIRLSKARQIKQSMMQELLTGRIRLI